MIETAGKIHALPDAAYQPSPNETYAVVFAMTKPSKQPGAVNPALERVARAVNLHASAGVPANHMRFVAVAYGEATPLTLNHAQYRAQFGIDNPNLPVIEELRANGVDIAVCGQAVQEAQLQYDWIDPSVKLALSAITTITLLQHKGYALMPL